MAPVDNNPPAALIDDHLRAPRVCAALAHGLSPAELRRRCWARPHHGVVRPAGGWAAAYWQGVTCLDGRDRFGREQPVLLHMGSAERIRPRRGVQPTRCTLHPLEVHRVGGPRVTTPARAAYDQMRLSSGLVEAVVVADAALSRLLAGPARPSELADVIDGHVKTRGRAQVRKAWPFASGRAASPEETRVRMFAGLEAGLWRWRVNQPIFDRRGHLLGIPDLLDPALGYVVESDGSSHREALTHAADNVREEAFEHEGLVVVRASHVDRRRRDAFVRRLRAGAERAERTRHRGWTLEEPAWWRRSRLAHVWGCLDTPTDAPWESRLCTRWASAAAKT